MVGVHKRDGRLRQCAAKVMYAWGKEENEIYQGEGCFFLDYLLVLGSIHHVGSKSNLGLGHQQVLFRESL